MWRADGIAGAVGGKVTSIVQGGRVVYGNHMLGYVVLFRWVRVITSTCHGAFGDKIRQSVVGHIRLLLYVLGAWPDNRFIQASRLFRGYKKESIDYVYSLKSDGGICFLFMADQSAG